MFEPFAIGHYTDLDHATGCTVILCPPEGAVAGADVRGPAPATRETDLLHPGHLVERVHAVLLSGGSAFGLDAASGVMRYLEEQGVGFDVRVARVPIVPAAAIFDLAIGSALVRPDAEAGYRACVAARRGAVEEGNVGAGTGATVGHLLGPQWATKSGLGSVTQAVGDGITVGAVVVVNPFGDVVDPHTGEILAGTRKPEGQAAVRSEDVVAATSPRAGPWLDSANALQHGLPPGPFARANTTIGVIVTNASLTKEQANLVAMMAHDGIARAIRPSHTLFDGDALFVLSAGTQTSDVTTIGYAAAESVAAAIVRAVHAATALHGIPARSDFGF